MNPSFNVKTRSLFSFSSLVLFFLFLILSFRGYFRLKTLKTSHCFKIHIFFKFVVLIYFAGFFFFFLLLFKECKLRLTATPFQLFIFPSFLWPEKTSNPSAFYCFYFSFFVPFVTITCCIRVKSNRFCLRNKIIQSI